MLTPIILASEDVCNVSAGFFTPYLHDPDESTEDESQVIKDSLGDNNVMQDDPTDTVVIRADKNMYELSSSPVRQQPVKRKTAKDDASTQAAPRKKQKTSALQQPGGTSRDSTKLHNGDISDDSNAHEQSPEHEPDNHKATTLGKTLAATSKAKAAAKKSKTSTKAAASRTAQSSAASKQQGGRLKHVDGAGVVVKPPVNQVKKPAGKAADRLAAKWSVRGADHTKTVEDRVQTNTHQKTAAEATAAEASRKERPTQAIDFVLVDSDDDEPLASHKKREATRRAEQLQAPESSEKSVDNVVDEDYDDLDRPTTKLVTTPDKRRLTPAGHQNERAPKQLAHDRVTKKATIVGVSKNSLHSRDDASAKVKKEAQRQSVNPAKSIPKNIDSEKYANVHEVKNADHGRARPSANSNIANADEDATAGFFVPQQALPLTQKTKHGSCVSKKEFSWLRNAEHVDGDNGQSSNEEGDREDTRRLTSLTSSQLVMPPPGVTAATATMSAPMQPAGLHKGHKSNDPKSSQGSRIVKQSGPPRARVEDMLEAALDQSMPTVLPRPEPKRPAYKHRRSINDSGYQSAMLKDNTMFPITKPVTIAGVPCNPVSAEETIPVKALAEEERVVAIRAESEQDDAFQHSNESTSGEEPPSSPTQMLPRAETLQERLRLAQGSRDSGMLKPDMKPKRKTKLAVTSARDHTAEEQATAVSSELDGVLSWRLSLRAHQRSLFDQLVKDAESLVSYLVHREECIQDLVDDYRRRGQNLVQQMEISHAKEYQKYCEERERRQAYAV